MTTLAVTQSIDPVKGGALGMAVCDLHRAMAQSCGEDTAVIGIDGDHFTSDGKFWVHSFPGVGPAGAYFNPALGRYGNRPGWHSVVAGSLAAACPPLGRGVFAAWGGGELLKLRKQ